VQRPSLSLKQESLWFNKDGPLQALIALFDKRPHTITEDNLCAVIGQYLFNENCTNKPLGKCSYYITAMYHTFLWLQRSKVRPFWSPWRVEKNSATKISAKVANLATPVLALRR